MKQSAIRFRQAVHINDNFAVAITATVKFYRLWLARVLMSLATMVLIMPAVNAEHDPANTNVLEPMVVSSSGEAQSLTIRSTIESIELLRQVPGGTTVIGDDEFRFGNTANLKEVLSLSPGVYVQSRFGGGETRTSIRGSGISQTFNTRGIRFLLNGLPFTEADGNFRSQLVEPLAMRHVEVYRGANALPYGAAFLGGAVNFVSPTGYSAPSILGHIEYGPYDFIRPQFSAAGTLGDNLDGYLSLSGVFQDGFRPQAEEETYRLYGNIGYRFSGNSETRLHVSIQDNNLELPGSLTQAQVKEDPTQANNFWRMRGAQRDFNLYRTDLQHAIEFAGSRLELGTFYQRLDMAHPLPFTFIESFQNDTGVSLRHLFDGQLGRFNHHFIWGGIFAYDDSDQTEFQSLGTAGKPVKGNRTLREEMEAITAELFAEDKLELTERMTLVAGLQLAYARRENKTRFGAGISEEENYTGVNPKLGLLYEASDYLQLFGNVSRSFEPPTNSEFSDAVAGVLDEQTATAIEIGTRRNGAHLSWELAAYHSWVEDEILTVDPNPPSGQFVTSNARETTLHSGVEFGFDVRFPLTRILGDNRRGDILHLLGNYTYNRFVFDDEPTWGDNDIPGIPRQFGRLELLYEHVAGFYLGPTLEAADSWYVDFANTLRADAFWLFGAKAGYRGRHFTVFIEGSNLTDRDFVSNTGLVANAGGVDTAVFNPGMPAAVVGGIEVKF